MTSSSTQGIKTVGFDAEGQHIGLVPDGAQQGMASPVAYWHVADIEAKLAEVTAAGAVVKEAPHDVGGGRLVATVTDPDGNVLGLLQAARRNFQWYDRLKCTRIYISDLHRVNLDAVSIHRCLATPKLPPGHIDSLVGAR